MAETKRKKSPRVARPVVANAMSSESYEHSSAEVGHVERIPDRLNLLHDDINDLNSSLDFLAQRLAPVLEQPEVVSEEEAKSASSHNWSDVRIQIEHARDRIRFLTGQVVELTGRLDV